MRKQWEQGGVGLRPLGRKWELGSEGFTTSDTLGVPVPRIGSGRPQPDLILGRSPSPLLCIRTEKDVANSSLKYCRVSASVYYLKENPLLESLKCARRWG